MKSQRRALSGLAVLWLLGSVPGSLTGSFHIVGFQILNPDTNVTEILASLPIKPEGQEANTGEQRIRNVANQHTLGLAIYTGYVREYK